MNDPRRDPDQILRLPSAADEADVDALAALFAEAAPAPDAAAVERLAAFAATQRPGVARRGKVAWVLFAAAASVAAFALLPRGPAEDPRGAVPEVAAAAVPPSTPVPMTPEAEPRRSVEAGPSVAAQSEDAGPLGEDPRDVLGAEVHGEDDDLWDDWAMAEVGAEALLDEPNSLL